jgi:hypothetical protein
MAFRWSANSRCVDLRLFSKIQRRCASSSVGRGRHLEIEGDQPALASTCLRSRGFSVWLIATGFVTQSSCPIFPDHIEPRHVGEKPKVARNVKDAARRYGHRITFVPIVAVSSPSTIGGNDCYRLLHLGGPEAEQDSNRSEHIHLFRILCSWLTGVS